MASNINLATCEPFRAWNRLEGRPRRTDLSQALAAEIADPLWMLGRQWQFGELKGEDTGSAMFARLVFERTEINEFRAEGQPAEPFDGQRLPLETLVESEPIPRDFRLQARAGRHFLTILGEEMQRDGLVFDFENYQKRLAELFPIRLPEPDPAIDDPAVQVQKAQATVNEKLQQFVAALGSKAADGLFLFDELEARLGETVARVALFPLHLPTLARAAGVFRLWAENALARSTSRSNAWQSSQLEYNFEVSLPSGGGAESAVLRASEYYQGHLDWFNFDLESPIGQAGTSRTVQKTIPSEAQFAGMPNARFWAFEDGRVDLGHIHAEPTDLVKMVVSQFALIYGNNWLLVPCELPVGSLTGLKGLIVTDVFGFRSQIRPARQGERGDWQGWGLFNLATRPDPAPDDARLFLPPAVMRPLESEPTEDVRFARDEMANQVWAIEAVVSDGFGRGQDGHRAAQALENWINPPAPVNPRPFDEPATGNELRWTLATQVPENWIPFVPVHADGSLRSMRLQRASMPRYFGEAWSRVRPRTGILRVNLEQPLGQLSGEGTADRQVKPYFINEEEVTRTGVRVITTFQRARWLNGKTHNWLGRRKVSGRGEASSGLVFDKVDRLAV